MITYIPYSNFTQCAMVLPDDLLEIQVNDATELFITAVTGREKWKNTGSAVLWRDCPVKLYQYAQAMAMELDQRNVSEGEWLAKVSEIVWDAMKTGHIDETNANFQPWWLGKTGLHLSHRSMLLEKRPQHFGSIFESGLRPGMGFTWLDYRPPVPVDAPLMQQAA